MDTLKERVDAFIAFLNISVRRFETNCGLTNGTVAGINKSIVSTNLAKIATAYPHLNLRWLLLGEGDMLIPLGESPKEAQIEGDKDETDKLIHVELNGPEIASFYKESLDRMCKIVDTQSQMIESLNTAIKLLTNDRH